MNRSVLLKILVPVTLFLIVIAIFTYNQPQKTATIIKRLIFSDTGEAALQKKKSPVEGDLAFLNEKWTGDFDKMAERSRIRVLVPYSKTFYFFDGIDQRGLTYDQVKSFETYINDRLNRDILEVRVVIIPTRRDRLIPDLINGLGDIAAGNLTITPERLKQVDFSNHGLSGVDEILVTCPGGPEISTIDDLSGKTIFVRESSSYFESLKNINSQFTKQGKEPIHIQAANELLEDEDILEMMNACMIPITIIDSHKAECWMEIFEKLTFHFDITVRQGGQIAWAIRKNCPKLKKIVNDFGHSHKKGTLMGNMLFNRYFKTCKWINNPIEIDAFDRFENAAGYFKKYAEKYGFDWRMIAALAYQESRIDQTRKSPSGAVGVMQVMPGTAADPNVNIPDINDMESNIHAGVKYLRFVRDRYFENQPMDPLNKMLFSFAGYNAGPAMVTRLRRETAKMRLDPNVWFDNVEVAAAQKIGRETVQYVSNIYKYYIAYSLVTDAADEKRELKQKYIVN